MRNLLSLISTIHEKGNRFIIEELKSNGADGLVPSHGDILVCLYQNDKMTMKEIADKINKLGYIKREISQEDSRYTYIVLTKKGQDFKPVFEKISEDLNNMLYKNLSEDESDILENLLQKI